MSAIPLVGGHFAVTVQFDPSFSQHGTWLAAHFRLEQQPDAINMRHVMPAQFVSLQLAVERRRITGRSGDRAGGQQFSLMGG